MQKHIPEGYIIVVDIGMMLIIPNVTIMEFIFTMVQNIPPSHMTPITRMNQIQEVIMPVLLEV